MLIPGLTKSVVRLLSWDDDSAVTGSATVVLFDASETIINLHHQVVQHQSINNGVGCPKLVNWKPRQKRKHAILCESGYDDNQPSPRHPCSHSSAFWQHSKFLLTVWILFFIFQGSTDVVHIHWWIDNAQHHLLSLSFGLNEPIKIRKVVNSSTTKETQE